MSVPQLATRATGHERHSSASLRPFAQDSLEPPADLIKADVEPTRNSQQGAEPRVDGAALQLTDAVELGADALRKALLSQVGLPPQLFDDLAESGVGIRTWLAAAAGRHSPREPFPPRRFALADLTANVT